MNFWSDSVKLKSPTQNESFDFDIETPRGHLFAILNFSPHDYANLNASLQRKLETIVRSFDSVPGFSTDLFLGFLAREINNFLHDLGKQSPGPQLFSSASLCLISGNLLAYFVCGDMNLHILGSGGLHSLRRSGPAWAPSGSEEAGADPHELSVEAQSIELDELGVSNWDAPLTDRMPTVTLNDNEVLLVTSGGAEEMSDEPEFSAMLQGLRLSDPKEICDAVIENRFARLDEGTVLVISGPYGPYVDPLVTDLSKAVDSLAGRVDALAEGRQRISEVPDLMEKTLEAELEQRIYPQIDELKSALTRKANCIDVLELNEILKNLGLVLASKADTTDLLSLQKDILKRGIVTGDNHSPARWGHEDSGLHEEEDTIAVQSAGHMPGHTFFGLKTALLVFVVAIGAAFIGAWLQSRTLRKDPEVWAVKSSGSQIWINRMDQGGQGNVALNLATPLKSQGEQTFSSFSDVKRYVETITASQPSPVQDSQVAQHPQSVESQQPDTLPKVSVNADDLSKPSAQADKLTPRKSAEPNGLSGKKPEMKTPRIAATAASSPASAASLKRDRRVSNNSVATTSQVKVATGDTLEKLAKRYKTTPQELRRLNPRINERGVIQPNQKIMVPASSSSSDSKGRRLALVKSAH